MSEHGLMNPFSTKFFVEDAQLYFKCPTCPDACSVYLEQIDPIGGVLVVCPGCGNIAHVPGCYRTQPESPGFDITGGVLMPIKEFTDWFLSHPLIASMKSKRAYTHLYDYGLWALCPACGYRYSPTVLAYNLPFMKIRDASGSVLLTKTEESATETSSLQAGCCPSCGHQEITAIVSDIPDYVRKAFSANRKK